MSSFDYRSEVEDGDGDGDQYHPMAAIRGFYFDNINLEQAQNWPLNESDFIEGHFKEANNPRQFANAIKNNIALESLISGMPPILSNMILSRARGSVELNAVRAFKIYSLRADFSRNLSLFSEKDQLEIIACLELLGIANRSGVLSLMDAAQ